MQMNILANDILSSMKSPWELELTGETEYVK